MDVGGADPGLPTLSVLGLILTLRWLLVFPGKRKKRREQIQLELR